MQWFWHIFEPLKWIFVHPLRILCFFWVRGWEGNLRRIPKNAHISAVWPLTKKIKALCFLQLWKLKKTKCLYFFDWRPDSRDTAILLHYLASARARSPSPKPKRRAISLTLSPASFIPKIFPLHITWRYHIMICQAFSIGLRSGEFPGQSIHLKGRLHTKTRNSRIN